MCNTAEFGAYKCEVDRYMPSQRDRTCPSKEFHAIAIIGFEPRQGERDPALLIKNSWSQEWGCGGLANISITSEYLPILKDFSYVELEDDLQLNSVL